MLSRKRRYNHLYRKPYDERMRILTAQVDETGKEKKNVIQRMVGMFKKGQITIK